MAGLLDKAKAVKENRGGRPSIVADDDRMELALAWVKGEVSLTQIMAAIGRPSTSNFYALMAVGLREAYRKGLLKNGDSKNS